MKSIFSFDVFDTCLTRIYARPADLFYDLAHPFLKSFCQYGYDNNSILLFAQSRQRAERQARYLNRLDSEDISLSDIYKQLKLLLPWHFDAQKAMAMEMKIEYDSLRAVLPVKLKIDELRQQGHQIIFISDMYLPTYFIKQCLIDKEIARHDDAVYVSGDIGLTKHSGNLFNKVLEVERIKPEQLLHCGDNYHSDIKSAQNKEIKAIYFIDAHLSYYEYQNIKRINSHDISIISKLSGTSRLVRLNNSSLNLQQKSLQNLSGNIISPLLIAYVSWVMNDAKSRGLKRLYFVSRDGQILFKIANKINKENDYPECRYLYGSRQAWYLPSVTSINKSELDWLINLHDRKSIRDLLFRFNIVPEEINVILSDYEFHDYDSELSQIELTKFWLLLEEEHVQNVILEKAQNALNITKDYFLQEGLFDDNLWAIVDTGWRLTCQRALNRVLNLCNYEGHAKGYYLAIRKDHVNLSNIGEAFPFLSHSNSNIPGIKNQDWIFEQGIASVIENVFTLADHAPVIGYQSLDSAIYPVYKNDFYKPNIQELRITIEDIIFSYIKIAQENNIDFLKKFHLPYINFALASSKLFFTNPPIDYIKAIQWVPVDIEQNHDTKNARKLAAPIDLLHLLKMIIYVINPHKMRFSDPNHAWYRGSAMLSSKLIRLLFNVSCYFKRYLEITIKFIL